MSPDAYLVAAAGPHQSPPPWPDPSPELQLAHVGSDLRIWVSSRTPRLQVTEVSSSTVLIGDAYASGGYSGGAADRFDVSQLAGLDMDRMCDRLMQTGWGRYVLITHASQMTAAFRNPSGALDCLTWRQGEIRFFAGRLPRELDPLLPTAVSIDWSIVARQLQDPSAVSGASALRNVSAVAPGALWIAEAATLGRVRQLWRPSEIARQGWRGRGDAAQMLREQVQTCVATLAKGHLRLVAEVSGGLDSAIVAAALIHAEAHEPLPSRALRWVNYATEDIEGDEREYARAIARHLRIDLTERRRTDLRYNEATLGGMGADFRVGLTALDPDYDADLVDQARDQNAEALITGQGGDAVFLQMAFTDVLADRLRLRGRLNLSEVLAHSRRRRCSVWRTLGATIGRATWPALQKPSIPSYLSDRTLSPDAVHPWLADIDGLPAAKAVQIAALVASQNVFGPSLRSGVFSCLHPLLSQPVVELTLALPSYELTRGGADRALARSAFASCLPQVLRERRSKGSMQAFYGRAVAASLDVLRPWLLDGVLVRERLIKIDRLEPLLDPDVLIMSDVYVDILHVAAVEAWARGWTERLATIKNRPAVEPRLDCRSGI